MISTDQSYHTAIRSLFAAQKLLSHIAVLKHGTVIHDPDLKPFVDEFFAAVDDAASDLSVALEKHEEEIREYEALIEGGVEVRKDEQLGLPLDIRRR